MWMVESEKDCSFEEYAAKALEGPAGTVGWVTQRVAKQPPGGRLLGAQDLWSCGWVYP